jgi:hypothetical protein
LQDEQEAGASDDQDEREGHQNADEAAARAELARLRARST